MVEAWESNPYSLTRSFGAIQPHRRAGARPLPQRSVRPGAGNALRASPACPARTQGTPRTHSARAITNAIRSPLRTGCPRRHLPGCFPPGKTAYEYVRRWAAEGTMLRVRAELCDFLQVGAGRAAEPSAAVIDSP
ncbi:hypothetical protein GCM10009799_44450 [Nocardiopsis rhodophaea]|uniref:Insertion element IS402-like domain-containing protein n=1 Tax=Nocardiopsis rhodophaea TaxID=280238 RepID=A0ABN2TJG6_9ACTN